MLRRVETVGSDAVIYLAARISRTSKDPKRILEELRDQERVRRLIKNLLALGHYSVFEHSFVRVYLDCEFGKLREIFFDLKYVELSSSEEGAIISFNLRTALEMLSSNCDFLKDLAKMSISCFPILASALEIKTEGRPELKLDLTNWIEEGGIRIYSVITSDHPNEKHAFFAFLVEGVSRVCSHQFVRHRTLSFTQQSQRHVKPQDFFLPWRLKPEASRLMLDGIESSFKLYEKLLKMGVKKEDARYILPQATSTRLFVSGRKSAWNHFLDLRLDPSAQAEIREVAQMISYFIRKGKPKSGGGLDEVG